MFEPRPDRRTATRTFSAMARGPIGAGAPRLRGPGDGAALAAGSDMADREYGFAHAFEQLDDVLSIVLRDDQRHADPAIEGARELFGLDIALGLEEGHQPRLRPGIGMDEGVQVLG